MVALPVTELTDRAREIFRHVVEGYIGTGNPVGSKTLAQSPGVDLSPASIRSVLAELEHNGLLTAPHTSAGRMPTELGLRLFVDGMMQVAEPSMHERAAIEQCLSEPGPIEAALEATSAILSELSACAGVVMVPHRDPNLSQFSLVRIAPDKALAVLVGDDGAIENRILELPAEIGGSALEEASNYITAQLSGRTLGEAVATVHAQISRGETALNDVSRELVERGLAIWSEDALQRPVLIVRGQANLLDDTALSDIERVRSLLDDLENKQSVAELLELSRDAKSARIFIGAENRLFALSGSSVIASPYHDSDGRVVGVVGVIGPTRLNYARVVPMVDFTAQSLGKLIG
ncbi:MAG: heat-inducible transcriptional repressor HrcA [Sphingomonadaceae bacterium]|nr:heat-inducible transcriptional repressor HrcA [Sphingomonadaceae bacterium]